MFELGTIDDLLVPTSPSTGRALDSIARRRTFEDLKRWTGERETAHASARPSLEALARSFAARLPGDPHAIAHAIADASTGALLRSGIRSLSNHATCDDLEAGVERLLVAIGDREAPGDEGIRVFAIEGRTSFRTGDRVLLRSLGIDEVLVGGPLVTRTREALDVLREVAPALRSDVDRFAGTCIASTSKPHELPSGAIGIAVVDASADVVATIGSLVGSVVAGKLHVLTNPSTDFVRGAAQIATAHVLRRAIARRVLAGAPAPVLALRAPEFESRGLPEPLHPVLAEWRSLAD